ncbi:MAG: hypothetical protein IJ309_02155 [Clostridia bacterium]|nr:hypothetical protein [Clostridia bacterium]
MDKIKKTKWFWLYFVGSGLLLVLGIMLLPAWESTEVFFKSLGSDFVNYIIGGLLVVYSIFYLIPRCQRHKGSFVQILMVIEIVLMVVIAIGCVLVSAKIINLENPCQILALALWCRGVIEVFCGVFHIKEGNKDYAIWKTIIAILLVTLGAYFFASPFFQKIHLQWIVAVSVLIVSVTLLIVGFIAKPKR